MKTIENNRLIAEFMGFEKDSDQSELYFTGHNTEYQSATVDEMRFNVSWDWLMPVVHKCLGICHEGMIDEWENSFADEFLSCSIEVLYNETVAFITWYNTNK